MSDKFRRSVRLLPRLQGATVVDAFGDLPQVAAGILAKS